MELDGEGKIAAIGLRSRACAIGQASAAIFADAALGKTRLEIAVSGEAIRQWLSGEAPQPDWPGLAAIAPAVAFPGRHGAILLAWRAAAEAR